jgi:hypothetical protein
MSLYVTDDLCRKRVSSNWRAREGAQPREVRTRQIFPAVGLVTEQVRSDGSLTRASRIIVVLDQ